MQLSVSLPVMHSTYFLLKSEIFTALLQVTEYMKTLPQPITHPSNILPQNDVYLEWAKELRALVSTAMCPVQDSM